MPKSRPISSQLDESLEALNRIAQTTSFQGRKLLDGSLDFTTTAGTNFNRINSLQIDQANLGATGSVAVSVAISAAATQAQVDVTNIPAATAAAPPAPRRPSPTRPRKPRSVR